MPLLASIYYSYKQFRITCNLFVKVMFKYVLNVLLIFATLIVPSIKLALIRFVEFTTALVRDLNSISTAINIWLFVLFIKIMFAYMSKFCLKPIQPIKPFCFKIWQISISVIYIILFPPVIKRYHQSKEILTIGNLCFSIFIYCSSA